MKIYILIFLLIVGATQYTNAAQPLYSSSIEQAILESANNKRPILAIFTARWCKNCGVLKNEIIDNQNNFENYIICYIDYDTNKELVNKYQVSAIPHSIILDQNYEKKRKIGFFSIKDYINWLKK